MKRIVSIGLKIPSENDDISLKFDSNYSLADADIILFQPDFEGCKYYTDYDSPKYNGKILYSDESSFQIKEDTARWRSELIKAFEVGKTIIILLKRRDDFFIHTGRKETSGTGRNQKVTNIVESFSNYSFLPMKDINIIHSVGSSVFCINTKFENFFNAFRNYIVAENYVETSIEIEPAFSTKSKDRKLGFVFRGKNNGLLIFLPNIVPGDKEVKREPRNKKKWTKEALEFGRKFNFFLLELDKDLRTSIDLKTRPPEWLNLSDFELISLRETKKLILDNDKKIEKLKDENTRLLEVIAEEESLRDLLFETGKPLELAVIKALKILGYKAENFQSDTLEIDQIILSPEGDRFIGECEGKDSKDIDVSKFRQLMDNIFEDFQRAEINEKAFGLIFGNPQRLLAPNKRTLDFTIKCKNGAKREGIGLIKTADLFLVCNYVLQTKDEYFKKMCRDTIKKQLGGVIVFPTLK